MNAHERPGRTNLRTKSLGAFLRAKAQVSSAVIGKDGLGDKSAGLAAIGLLVLVGFARPWDNIGGSDGRQLFAFAFVIIWISR